jgi:hypothetical protein
LAGNSTGNQTVAVGYQALILNTASENTAVGASAGIVNTTGTANAFFGQASGYSNTTGSFNTFLGRLAGLSNTTASNNTAVGYQALYSNTTGTNNTAIGYLTLDAVTTGNGNVAFGNAAGGNLSTGSSNTFIGEGSGSSTTSDSNTFLGRDAGYLVTSGAKNTIIGRFGGNSGGLDIRTASNYIVLSDGDGNPRGIFNNTGALLVNTTTVTNTGQVCMDFNGASAEGLTIKNTVNTTNSAFVQFYNSSATKIGSISNPTSSSIAYNTSSDYRLKNTIAPMTGALARVAALKPCTYKWNADGADGEGFIAHELAEVCPSAVTGEKDAVDADGNIKPQGIDTSFLVATLTAAIQELKAEVDSLKSQLNGA